MDLLQTIIWILVAIILFSIARPFIITFFMAIGAIIAIPPLWVYENIERKLRLRRLEREKKRAKELGLGSPFAYRSLLKRAKEDGISIEEYIEKNGTSIRGARW